MATNISFLFHVYDEKQIGVEQTRILENMNPLTSWLRSSVRGSSRVTPVTQIRNRINKRVINNYM
jgi:hypothetical protein